MAEWPYNTAAWQKLRALKLATEPLCEDCLAGAIIRAARCVDHRVAISDGGEAFPPLEELSSKCWPCHSRKTARGPEAGAFRSGNPVKGCNADGSPLDPAHHWNDGPSQLPAEIIEQRMPSNLRPSAIPLTIVTGPPGSGKSTLVRERAGPRDLVICLDSIFQEMTGLPEHHTSSRLLGRALNQRNKILHGLADDREHDAAWFIVAAPDPDERRKWVERLGGTLVVVDTPLADCIKRIEADPSRSHAAARMIESARSWWRKNPHLVRAPLKKPDSWAS